MRISKVKDVHIVVYVRSPWVTTAENRIADLQIVAEDVAKQIRRHVDNIGTVEVIRELAHTCEHCGYDWTEASTTYNGGCCDKDEENSPNKENP